LNRREALALLAASPSLVAFRSVPEPVAAAKLPSGLGALAETLRTCARAEAFERAGVAIRAGATPSDILAAVFQAGILDVRPRHVGGKLHCVMVVESAFQLAESTDRQGAWLLALWNLDDLKRSQELDRGEGDWVLPARPSVSFATETAARAEFLSAMDAWDEERADRALVGLIPFHQHASLFELLWPLAARSYVNIGHKAIFAAQVERVLSRIGWAGAEPALRSLVYGLLHRPSGTQTEAFDHARELAAELPAKWLAGREDAAESERLLRSLRGTGARQAQDQAAAALRAGLGTGSVWDALRLWASELFLRRLRSRPAEHREALLPVHAVTVVNALGHAWRSSGNDATRRLVMLQAAGWLALLRDDLAAIAGLGSDTRAIETLAAAAADAPAASDDALREPTAAAAYGLLRRTGEASAFRSALAGHLARKADEHHQHKYAAAAFEESRLAHPRWQPQLLACAVPYLPGARDPDTELAQRSLRVLQQAGV
jgi:hypothetical protein